jgi:hypothetical protein
MNQEHKRIPMEATPKIEWLRALVRRLFRVALALTIFFFCLGVVAQVPFVQTWAVREITASLSKTLNAKVTLEYFSLSFFDKFILRGLYVEDARGDTLFYSRRLLADINLNPFVLMRRGLEVEEIRLSGAELNIRRLEGEYQDNLQAMLRSLFPAPDPQRERKPFRFNLRGLSLDQVRFTKSDAWQGNNLSIQVLKGHIELHAFDLSNKRIHIGSAELVEPIVSLEDFETPTPQDEHERLLADTIGHAAIDSVEWLIAANNICLSKGRFSLRDYRRAPSRSLPPDKLDYSHLDAYDIDLDIQNFSVSDWTFQGQINRIAAKERSGFELSMLAAEEAYVSPQGAHLNGMVLLTPYSQLGDTLAFQYLEYADFKDFPNRVLFDLRLHKTTVAIKDIMVFVPALEQNAFFQSNREEVLRLDGEIGGRINNLRGSDLTLELADGSRLEGIFRSRNLAVRKEEFLDLRLSQLRTSMRTLRQLIPGFNPPANFDKLGRLDFSGTYYGFFTDFAATGELRTDLGQARMDMRMNLKRGREKADYSGQLTLSDFDLGQWSGNDDLGKISLVSKVIKGEGLAGENANVILEANVESLQFRGYNYENAVVEGNIRYNHFDGSLDIQDENINLQFKGIIDLKDQDVPVYNFAASVGWLDLKNLNFSEKDLVLRGDVDINLRNLNLRDLEGVARVNGLRILHQREREYHVDSIVLASEVIDTLGNKIFSVSSDILSADLRGRFDIERAPEAFLGFLRRHYPAFAQHMGIKPREQELPASQFTYDVRLAHSRGLQRLLAEQLGDLQNVRLTGAYHSAEDSLSIDFESPYLEWGKIELFDVVLLFKAEGEIGELDLGVDSIVVNRKLGLDRLALTTMLQRDTALFGLSYFSDAKARHNSLKLDGRLFALDSVFLQISFFPADLVLFEEKWDIRPGNYLRFGGNTLLVRDFALVREDKRILLESLANKGLRLSLLNFGFDQINGLWDYEPLQFSGRYQAYAVARDIFQMKDFSLIATSDTLFVNGDDWGRFRLDVLAPDLRDRVNAYMSIAKDTSQLAAEGYVYPQSAPGDNPPADKQAGYFDFGVGINRFPLAYAEYFIGETVSGTLGGFDAELRFRNPGGKLDVSGNIKAFGGGVTIDYLKTRYTFQEANITVNNTMFDASGTILRDETGNTATLYGGVRHNRLRDLGFSARLSTNQFLALNTRKGDNDMFYGRAVGIGQIWFSGSFQQPDIYINAEVGEGTELVIPVSGGVEAGTGNYVTFVDKRERKEANGRPTDPATLRGVSLEMDLRLTNAAAVKIVFDEQAGDIIEGSGRGNIRIIVPRGGEGFAMHGEYQIDRGDYLFTMYNVVNKSFLIRQGGVIRWSGDPYGAIIDLEAEYKGLNTPVANLITEYLVGASADLKNEASKSTEVNLVMRLRGELMQPVIDFDIGLPALRGALQNYTDSKLRILKQDQNELNKQVFGLVVAGQFLPSDLSLFTGSEIIYRTMSELVSNQLSMLLTNLFSEVFEDGKVFSGIDFDIAYNPYQNLDLGEGQNINRGDELQLRLRQNFFDDRLSILVGGNFGLGTGIPTAPSSSGAFVGNDLVIEYVLNRDRSLKLRVYQLLAPDIGGGRRLEIGTGLSFRREFNTFSDFINNLQNAIIRIRKSERAGGG